MTAINPTLYLNNNQQPSSKGKQMMGKDDFLKLLIAQMQNQDPLSPMKNTEYISQMANFTSLEQTQNMNTMLQNFISSQTNNALVSQSTMIGKQITWQKDITTNDGGSSTENVQGIVNSVSLANGKVVYNTVSGDQVSQDKLISVEQPAAAHSV